MKTVEEIREDIESQKETLAELRRKLNLQQKQWQEFITANNLDPNLYERLLADPKVSDRDKELLRTELAQLLEQYGPASGYGQKGRSTVRLVPDSQRLI